MVLAVLQENKRQNYRQITPPIWSNAIWIQSTSFLALLSEIGLSLGGKFELHGDFYMKMHKNCYFCDKLWLQILLGQFLGIAWLRFLSLQEHKIQGFSGVFSKNSAKTFGKVQRSKKPKLQAKVFYRNNIRSCVKQRRYLANIK